MAIDRGTLAAVQSLLRPIATRAANMIARGVIQLVNDDKKMQLVQLGVLVDEDVEGEAGAEHFQPYGLASVPLPGAEAIVMFPNGDRSHPLVPVVSDRRHRPTGGEPGQVMLHNHVDGTRVILMANGDIEIHPAPGREVFIRDEGGNVDRLVKKSEHDGHKHPPGTFTTAGGGPVTGESGGAPAVAGTQRLRVQ